MFVKKIHALFFIAIALLLQVGGTAWARGAPEPVYNPEFAVSGKSLATIKKAIRKTVFRRNWEIVKEAGSSYVVQYIKTSKRSSIKVVVKIHYSQNKVRMSYVDSEGLSYDKAAGTVHRTYNRWVKNLEKGIRTELDAF